MGDGVRTYVLFSGIVPRTKNKFHAETPQQAEVAASRPGLRRSGPGLRGRQAPEGSAVGRGDRGAGPVCHEATVSVPEGPD